ncbi:hypothetical protein [Nocardia sp. Marseille-Q1738]
MSAKEIQENFSDLAERVDAAGGALATDMGELRDLVQAGRLAPGPISQIEHNLERVGLAATELTQSQWAWTLVYRTSSPVGRIIDAAHGGTEHSHTDLFKAIKEVAAKDAAANQTEELDSLRATVEQIKALVTAI